jgi:hypothetical protein
MLKIARLRDYDKKRIHDVQPAAVAFSNNILLALNSIAAGEPIGRSSPPDQARVSGEATKSTARLFRRGMGLGQACNNRSVTFTVLKRQISGSLIRCALRPALV